MDNDLNKPQTENLAGIIWLKFIDISNVECIENGILTLKPGFSMRKIHTSREKWSLDGYWSTNANDGFDFKVSGIISGHDKNILANSILASTTDLLLLINLDNIMYAAGNLDEGIHFSFTQFSGIKPGDETGYKLEFFRKLRRPVMIIDQIL